MLGTAETVADRMMAIAEDDDRIIFTGYEGTVTRPKKLRATREKPSPRNLLLIGWSKMGDRVLSELAGFLPSGSSVDVVARSAYIDDDLEIQRSYGTLKVQHIEATGKFTQLQTLSAKKRYDEALLLGYRSEKISEAEADGQTLLAKTASVDDLFVSENLAALLIAQLSENPKLAAIFKDLFSPTRGSAVHVRPEGADAREVALNPAKDAIITPKLADGLIVIGKSGF